MSTFVLIHGSWHNGTAWRKLQAVLDARGVTSYAPTMTGFESAKTPATPEMGLRTNIDEMVRLIEDRALTEVILVGHSYGGLVISGVAARIPDRISKLVYLDAFIPESDQSLFDIMGAEQTAGMRANLVDAEGRSLKDGAESVWLLPAGHPQDYGVSDPADVQWLEKEMPLTAVRTFEEGVPLGDTFRHFANRCYFIRCTGFDYLASQECKAIGLHWKTYQLPTGHDAMVTMPNELADHLLEIAADI